jgi:small-conductance mechanosensitive channel
VDFNGELNIIETISIRSIRTRTLDNVERVIPNNDFLSSSFTTYTGKSRLVRLKLRIGVSYQDNHRLVIETLLDVAKASEAILQQPTPEVRVFQFGDFSIDYDLLIWVPDPLLIPRIRNEMHQGILDAFEAKGIKIPFPVVEILDGGKAS